VATGVDYRVIDGAVAADFLQGLKSKLEKHGFTFLFSMRRENHSFLTP